MSKTRTKFDEHAAAQRKAEEAEFGPCKRIAELMVRMHPSLKESIVSLASNRGVSVNVLVRDLLLAEHKRAIAEGGAQ
jgi:predicted HicB family RNase H-like nuclease